MNEGDRPLARALPTAAASRLAALVGDRIVGVRRVIIGAEPDASATGEAEPGTKDSEPIVTTRADPRDGATELTFASGAVLTIDVDERRHALVVSDGPLPPAAGPIADCSRDAFWRYRLRRELLDLRVHKSLDVAADAAELEFGLELVLRFTPGVLLEYVSRDGVAGVVVNDGSSAEPCRRLRIG